MDPVLADLAGRIRAAQRAAGLPEAETDFERPKNPDHGDWATSIALRSAKQAGRPPRDIATALVEHLDPPEVVDEVTIAGPGFLNFRFAPRYFEDAVRQVLADGESFGRRKRDDAERINIEFVSANPTGPLHAGHGRWAAAGDALAEVLAADGNDVDREYYVNDAGEQIRLFGESVLLAGRGDPLGEDHYKGGYVADLASELREEHGDALFASTDEETVSRVAEAAVERMLEHIRETLHRMGVHFDVYFSERTLHERDEIGAAIAELSAAGHTYEQDGARFLRTTAFGDDKDRVLVRQDGRPTYFAADCAYFMDKRDRGYDRLIYVLGADHHGYLGRMRALARCFGVPDDALEIRIGQNVNLLRGGEPVKMSKRAGEFVTLDEVVEEVGADVARYVYLRQSLDTAVDFDLDVVAQQSMDNPVYYVQYAHARIASVVRYADDSGFRPGDADTADLSWLTHPAEVELLRGMAMLPEIVAGAAELRAPQRVARYAEDLASSFHRFYTECRIVQEDEGLARARYWLAVAAKRVLGNALAILRVSAPDRM
ncbi:MAG: arginine--tRNA ligase [Actinobacteria bacterium]|nr:arginine--tRNA ligase [Actinomycetota bacterium]